MEAPATITSFSPTAPAARGAVVVGHGLNTKPEVMDQLIGALNAEGFHCERVSLYGDESTRRASPEVIADAWLDAYSQGYQRARRRVPAVPVHNLSFSIGALVSLHFLEQTPRASFDAMYLLAPPVALTATARLIRLLTPLAALGVVLPSAAPQHVRARPGTPLSEYAALLAINAAVQTLRRGPELAQIPTKICLDRRDELVSFEGVSRWMQRNALRSWSLAELGERDAAKRAYKHLIVIEEAVGPRAWARLVDEVVTHFAGEQGDLR